MSSSARTLDLHCSNSSSPRTSSKSYSLVGMYTCVLRLTLLESPLLLCVSSLYCRPCCASGPPYWPHCLTDVGVMISSPIHGSLEEPLRAQQQPRKQLTLNCCASTPPLAILAAGGTSLSAAPRCDDLILKAEWTLRVGRSQLPLTMSALQRQTSSPVSSRTVGE